MTRSRLATMRCTLMPGRCGSRSIFVTSTRSALRNITGYFSGLSSPSVTDERDHVDGLAEVVDGGADEVADVLDEQIVELAPGKVVQRVVDHLGVEVTGRSGRDRLAPNARGPQPLGVVVGGEIAGERADAMPAAERARGRFEHRGLAGARRSHQVDRDHAARRESARDCAPPCARCRPESARAPPPARARDRRIRTCRTSRHLHLDPIEHDLVARRESRRRRRSAAQRSGPPRRDRPAASRARPVRPAPSATSSSRASQIGAFAERRRTPCVNSSTSTPDSSPMRTDSRCTPDGAARTHLRVDALDQRLNDRVLVHRTHVSAPNARRTLREEAVEAFGEVGAVGDAAQVIELAIEMDVEPIHARPPD